MPRFPPSAHRLSQALWETILEGTAYKSQYLRAEFFRAIDALDDLRRHAATDTGSIGSSSAWLLYSAIVYFRPARILEVGTYIGKSTLSMALGADAASLASEIHTCDQKNDLTLPAIARTRVVQYPRTTSTEMLRRIFEGDPAASFDFVHLDGQVIAADIPFLRKCLASDVVVALDDFEGMAKGVANVTAIRDAKLLPAHTLVYPCTLDMLEPWQLFDRTTTALLVPATCLYPTLL